MVDNFDIIRKILRFDNEGECYYVQLLRRAADDPKPDGKPDPAYHGNMHSRSVKDYFIHSLEHLDMVEGEIKELCKMFNVRAYIRLNRRSFKKIALQMLKHIAEQVSSGESYSSPHHMISSAAGMVHDEPNKTWLVDLDSEHLPYEQDIKNIICECEPIKSRIVDTMKFLSFGTRTPSTDTAARHTSSNTCSLYLLRAGSTSSCSRSTGRNFPTSGHLRDWRLLSPAISTRTTPQFFSFHD